MGERRDHDGKIPGDLPLFDSGWRATDWELHGGTAFWDEVAKIGPTGALADQVDAAMAGKAAPRVWLILHERGQPALSTAVALAFARELGSRDQASLVLDCDDREQTLTSWIERVEAEGWIDLVRYGTSVLTSGVPMPFDGRRGYVLGVGSFVPTDVTAKEIQHLVSRLRHQADDLILVAPADESGATWAAVASIRLLCWDRASRSAADLAAPIAALAAAGNGLTGLVGFGQPAPAPETTTPVVAPAGDIAAADHLAAPLKQLEPVISAGGHEEVDPAPAADDFEPAVSEPPAGPEAAAVAAQPDRDGPLTRRGTSGVFWFLATASAVIVAILGGYWYKYVRVPAEGHFQPIEMVVDEPRVERVPGDRVQGDIANQDDPHDGVTPPTTADSLAAVVDSLTGRVAGEEAATAGPDTQVVATGAGQSAPQKPETGTNAAAGPSAAGTVKPKASAFSMAHYRTTVGAAGWALHLYSLPNQAGVDAELVELHRRGFKTEVRAVDTPTKGRWWRIYVGNFATRAEARAAMPLLKKKLRADWANPTRF